MEANYMKDNKNLELFTILLAFIIISLAVCFMEAGILMWLWNIIIVYLFNIPMLTYWYSFGLIIISNIIFKTKSVINHLKEH